MAAPEDTEQSPGPPRLAVVRPPSSPELTILVIDEQSEASVRVIAFDSDGRASKEAHADVPGEDELWPAIATVASLTPEEAQQLEAQVLALLREPDAPDEDTGGPGIVGTLVIGVSVIYLVLLPIVGAVTIVRWLW